jgi:hypothetical protein
MRVMDWRIRRIAGHECGSPSTSFVSCIPAPVMCNTFCITSCIVVQTLRAMKMAHVAELSLSEGGMQKKARCVLKRETFCALTPCTGHMFRLCGTEHTASGTLMNTRNIRSLVVMALRRVA